MMNVRGLWTCSWNDMHTNHEFSYLEAQNNERQQTPQDMCIYLDTRDIIYIWFICALLARKHEVLMLTLHISIYCILYPLSNCLAYIFYVRPLSTVELFCTYCLSLCTYKLSAGFQLFISRDVSMPQAFPGQDVFVLKSEIPGALESQQLGGTFFDMGSFISHVIHEALQGFHAFQALEPVFEAWDFIYHPTTRSPDLLPGGFAPQGGENMLCRSCAKLDISTWLFFKIRFG